MKIKDILDGMPTIQYQIFDEAGILVTQYYDGIQNRLNIDISGHFDKEGLRELKAKIKTLKIDNSLTIQTKSNANVD